jgi:hypothetical protein
VSVIVPCFNHGRYLPECIASIRRQSYPAIETIVADDASAEPETIEALDLLEHEEGVTVVRLLRNSGPSAARNAAVSRAQGRYVLPLDADNVLEDDAVERLVEQLQGAGEEVGFIYPNVQYFGNRNDYFQAPDYNLYALLRGNFCDTCSLIDRDVFDAGLRYPEDILLGHEDWDFALALAARGVRGEPATARTFYLRKHGFNRSDEVEHAQDAFGVLLAGRYPGFFDAAADLKARWAPALSIVELEPMEPDGELVERTLARLHRQSTGDAELVLRADRPWPVPAHGPALRRVPATLGRSLAEALGPSLEAARGRYVLVTVGSSRLFLSDPAFVEKVLRTFEALPQLGGIAFTDTGHGFPYRPIHEDENVQLAPHSLIWRTDQPRLLRDAATVVPGKEIESLTGALARSFLLQWRHAPAGRSAPREDRYEGPSQTRLSPAVGLRPSARAERDLRLSMEPHIPRAPAGIVRRLRHTGAWVPPETAPLCRHRDAAASGRLHSNDRTAPPGYTLEFELGSINLFSLPGTARLVQTPEGSFELRPRDDPPRDGDGTLGFVEQAPLPLLTPLQLAREPETNQHVLVAGDADPLTGAVEILGFLGWIEPYPSEPRFAPQPELTYGGAVGLVRSADLAARRHVYGVGRAPESAELVGELGALLAEPLEGSVPVWLTDRGFLITDRYRPEHRRPALTQGLRWVLAPLAWRSSVGKGARVRAALRRAASLPGKLVSRVQPGRATTERPLGYLMAERSPALHVPLYAARHPVTGDQLLTRHRLEAADMGYVDVVLLGYLSSQAPVTREASLRRVSIPWASRFGLAVRTR